MRETQPNTERLGQTRPATHETVQKHAPNTFRATIQACVGFLHTLKAKNEKNTFPIRRRQQKAHFKHVPTLLHHLAPLTNVTDSKNKTKPHNAITKNTSNTNAENPHISLEERDENEHDKLDSNDTRHLKSASLTRNQLVINKSKVLDKKSNFVFCGCAFALVRRAKQSAQ